MLLYVNAISMFYMEDATKAAIDVKAKLSEVYMMINPGPAHQILGIEIHRKETVLASALATAISLGQKAIITMILK
jgi:hypothetical protein